MEVAAVALHPQKIIGTKITEINQKSVEDSVIPRNLDRFRGIGVVPTIEDVDGVGDEGCVENVVEVFVVEEVGVSVEVVDHSAIVVRLGVVAVSTGEVAGEMRVRGGTNSK